MVSLTGRPGIGPKQPKAAKGPRKPIPRRSAKRKAYMASDARKAGLAHMKRVKGLPCICCGAPGPSCAHHVTGDGKPRDDMRVLPLCYDCHQGQHGYHNAKAAWVAMHGPDLEMLPRVQIMLVARDSMG